MGHSSFLWGDYVAALRGYMTIKFKGDAPYVDKDNLFCQGATIHCPMIYIENYKAIASAFGVYTLIPY